MQVHRHPVFGFAKIVNKDALQIEAILKGVQVEREKEFQIFYKGKVLSGNTLQILLCLTISL